MSLSNLVCVRFLYGSRTNSKKWSPSSPLHSTLNDANDPEPLGSTGSRLEMPSLAISMPSA